MARKHLNRTLTLAGSSALACIVLFAVSASNATATTFSFKPTETKNGSVLFVIKSVRPESVRAAQIRIGHDKPHRLDLSVARRATRLGHLRLHIGPRLKRRGGRLKIIADTTPPETAITSGPTGTVSSQSASFAFSSPDSSANFQCRLDEASWRGCESPKSFSGLAAGAHTVSVRAYDQAGNVDSSPAVRSWTVEPRAQSATEPAPSPEPLPGGAVMYDGFNSANGANNLITNEYAAWHSWDSAAVDSPLWKSDGGSLFSVSALGPDGSTERVAYTGALDTQQADRYSEDNTHSSKLRFFTKAGGFGNVQVGAWIKPLGWGAGVPSSWGGFKLYLRREKDSSVSSAYTAEPYIYDGRAYIQKKCEGDTGGGTYANGGTYYLLASKSGLNVPLGSWHRVAASSRTNSDGSVTISLYRDGVLVLQTVDRGVGCAPLRAGHSGFRSDFLQYYLEDFTVSPQS